MSLSDPGPVMGKLCFVYCGDDQCNCSAALKERSMPEPKDEPLHPNAMQAMRRQWSRGYEDATQDIIELLRRNGMNEAADLIENDSLVDA